jgi:phage tail-like protein
MSDERADPYCRHRFDVDIGDGRPPLGFTDVGGLSVRVRARPTDEGAGDVVDRLDGRGRRGHSADRVSPASDRRTTSPPLTLRRGITDDRRLWDWLHDWVTGTVKPRTVRVFLLDPTGERARGWCCRDARPVRWDGPELAADRVATATETLELAHEGIEAIAGD